MPLFNPDILLHQAAGKAVIDTDKARGGLRSAIDDWTDLFGTYTDPGGNTKYVFQDEHTNASPGWLKPYSTMFYVADGRALVQDDTAGANFIQLNTGTGVYDTGGTKFVVDSSGDAEPEYWVLVDITDVGGSGSGTDKLPTFTIGGASGSFTAVPAGYEKLNVVTQAASNVDGFTALVLEDEDGDTLNIANGGTVKITGASAVTTNLVSPGGVDSLLISVDDATNEVSGLVQLFSNTVQTVAANAVSTTSSRTYGVQFNSDDQLVVNVPWTSTSGTVTAVTSATTDQLTVANGTSTPALTIVTGAVADNGTSLATGDQIYDFVVGYADPIGTDNSADVSFNSTITDVLTLSNQAVSATDPGDEDVIAGWDHSGNKFTYLSAADVRTAISVDVAGTDNSTDVTLASVTSNYLTLNDQQITAGTVPVTLGGTGLTTIAAGSLLQASTADTITALTGGSGQDGYLLSYDHSNTTFQLVAATATANDVEITLSGGTGITFSSTFTTNQSSPETINVTLDDPLVDIAGLNGTGLLSIAGTDVTIDTTTYLTSTDISTFIDNIDVTEATAVAHKVVLTTAAADGTITGVQIDSADLTFTPSGTDDRGKLTTGDLLVKGDFTVLGGGTVINLQQENVYVKDALITLGITDEDVSSVDGTAATVDVGLEAYKQGHDDAKSPTLVYDISEDYWAIDNMDHSASALTRIARTFKTAHTIIQADVDNGYFEITHNLHHEDIIVQVRDNGTDQGLVIFKYQTMTAEKVRISIGGGVAVSTIFNIVIVG